MDYRIGSRVRVKLCGRKVVKAEITAIVNRSAGRKVQVLFGDQAILIDPVQIIEVMRLAE
jgi:hypothetical protein